MGVGFPEARDDIWGLCRVSLVVDFCGEDLDGGVGALPCLGGETGLLAATSRKECLFVEVVVDGYLRQEQPPPPALLHDDSVPADHEFVEMLHRSRGGHDGHFDVDVLEFVRGDGWESWVFCCGTLCCMPNGLVERQAWIEQSHTAPQPGEFAKGHEDPAVRCDVKLRRWHGRWILATSDMLDDMPRKTRPGLRSGFRHSAASILDRLCCS